MDDLKGKLMVQGEKLLLLHENKLREFTLDHNQKELPDFEEFRSKAFLTCSCL